MPIDKTAVATRKAYGNALKRIFPAFPDIVVLDRRGQQFNLFRDIQEHILGQVV